MDIGTTTIYGQVIDLISGEVLAEHGEFNGQISYGEDVISRIVYAEKPGGLAKINEVVIKTINKILTKIVKRSGVDPENISTITLAGNTTMTQLMLAVDPRSIRRAPYVPAATLYPPIKASDLGMELGEHVAALVYPAVSSYVGGDIVKLCGRRYCGRGDGIGDISIRGPDPLYGCRYQCRNRDRQQRLAGMCGLFRRSGL
jgi:uncharacterized 2Fe-2S/4Fe-4S cluster protein (DUF4445 family)